MFEKGKVNFDQILYLNHRCMQAKFTTTSMKVWSHRPRCWHLVTPARDIKTITQF